MFRVEVFFISYSDGVFNWDDPIHGTEKTDNDIEALRALDEAEAMPAALPVASDFLGGNNLLAGFDLDIPIISRADNADAEGVDAKGTDSLFDRGEYWVHYFREEPPGDDYDAEAVADTTHDDSVRSTVKKIKSRLGKTIAGKEEKSLEAEDAEADSGKAKMLFGGEASEKRRGKSSADSEEILSAPKARNRIRNKGMITAAAVVAVLLVGMVVVAEPWVAAPEDTYVAPQPVLMGSRVELEVGETYKIDVGLGENEDVFSVTSEDSDILIITEQYVTARGEWDSAKVCVTTKEKGIPQPQPKPFKILGLDLTEPYYSLRQSLRDFFGIEKKQAPRTELRVLNIYEQEFVVKGYKATKSPTSINLYTNDRYELAIDVPEGIEVVFEYEGGVINVEQTLPSSNGFVTYTAMSSGTTGVGKIIAKLGFYKDGKFVTVSAIEYGVEVLQQPAPGEDAVFTSGNYNGSIPIEQSDDSE